MKLTYIHILLSYW